MVSSDIGTVHPVLIEDEMRSSYLDYAMSVIVSRALPDVRDGLKPVQRRILYAMHDQGMRPNTPFKKSARLVGEVMGKYHPHGDSPVYEAMVRMAQRFSMRYPQVDGQGNFGSVDGDPPAAMRYTEARLTRIAENMLADIDRETVDWVENFDASLNEPVVLPARLPNLLVNGASGIAVGMATNIAPHNLSEVCDAIVHLISNPDASVDDLMQFVTGPDFPTGAHIWGQEGIRSAYSTGRGRIVVQAHHEIEEMARQDRQRVVFTAIPYQVNKATLVAKIADLAKTRRVQGISEVRDESDRKGMRIVVELRRGASTGVLLNNLYRHTALRSSFSVNMLALVDGTPRVLTLKQALRHFIDFRRQVVIRRAEFDLRKAQARLHILEGLRVALEFLDQVIALIRASDTVDDARQGLMTQFGLSEIQAQAILDMQLRRLAALEREKIESEYQDLLKLVADLEALLGDPSKVLGVIRRETLAVKRSHGDERTTTVHPEELGVWRREDIEPHEEVVITLSKNGYVKRTHSDTFRRQLRGGKGVRGQRMTNEDDITPYLEVADTHDTLLFFTNRGRVFSTRVFELPADQSRQSRGTPVQNVVSLQPREEVNAVLAVSDLMEDTYLVMATRRGQIKRMHVTQLTNLRRAGLNVFKLGQGDELVSVVLADSDEDVVLVSEQGMAIRFPSSEVRPRLRAAGGTTGMKLETRDRVVAMDIARADGSLLIASRGGYGKISELRHYRQQHRGGKGLITLRITRKNGRVAAAQVVTDESEVGLLTHKAVFERISQEIRRSHRVTQGVILMKLDRGDSVSAINAWSPRRTPSKTLDPSEVPNSGNGNGNGVAHDSAEEDDAAPEEESPEAGKADE